MSPRAHLVARADPAIGAVAGPAPGLVPGTATLYPEGPTGPVAVVGVVRITGPNARGYYKLKWTKPDGTDSDTSGSKRLEVALAKAEKIDRDVQASAGPKSTIALATLVELFLADGRSPYKTQKPFKPNQLSQLRRNLRRAVKVAGTACALDVDRALLDRMRAQTGTFNGVRQHTSNLRTLLRWSYQHGYVTAEQSELLPERCVLPAPALPRGTAPARHRTARETGQPEDYVRDEDAPSATQIVALRTELAERMPRWGALAPELAAECGPRWSEQFQLTADDVHLDGCPADAEAHIHISAQLNNLRRAKDPSTWRIDVKANGGRRVSVPIQSITGYPLRAELARRCQAARAEQAAGRNPEALLFPAVRGGLMWHTWFSNKLLLPAMRAAGWPLQTWTEQAPAGRRRRAAEERVHTLADLTWHSLRHRFARTKIDVYHYPEGELMSAGGWANLGTVQNRYYRSGEENMKASVRRGNRRPAGSAPAAGTDLRAEAAHLIADLPEEALAALVSTARLLAGPTG